MSYDFCVKISAAHKHKTGNVMAIALGVAFALCASVQISTEAAPSPNTTADYKSLKRISKGVIGPPKMRPPVVNSTKPDYKIFNNPEGAFWRARRIGHIYQT